MPPSKIVCVVGTRPEVIKMAPVVKALRREGGRFSVRLLATGQHDQLLLSALESLGLSADDNLKVMVPDQTLAGLTASLTTQFDAFLQREQPDLVLAQGDTTSVFVAALTCFYRSIPFGHVEAGLRTSDIRLPFPEEFNRRVAGMLAVLHFAPTQRAVDALLRESVPAHRIFLTGNTCIDTLAELRLNASSLQHLGVHDNARVVLMTCHRRENFGAPMRDILGGVKDVVDRHPDIVVIFPVHPNPHVMSAARELLSADPQFILCEPLNYPDLANILQRAEVVVTDSGGLQEEAPFFGKPLLVTRTETERPEVVDIGAAKLVGSDRRALSETLDRLLTDRAFYNSMVAPTSPYGDGQAARRIVKAIDEYLQSVG